jgi:hypothetical protein
MRGIDEAAERAAVPHPDPRCPKCGYTMCELFDYAETRSPIAISATPNGRFQCYRCTKTIANHAHSTR